MSEMVERVARALFALENQYLGLSHPDDTDEAAFQRLKTSHIQCARALITAMREPTYPMIEAGGLAIYERNGDPTPEAEAEAQVAWPAMIDEALK